MPLSTALLQDDGIDALMMNEALHQAQIALSQDEVPIGAVVALGNQIIARAYNQVERLTDPTAHAEMIAVTMASHRLGGKYLRQCTLYVTLEPCPMCMGALRWSQIGRIVFGASDPKGGYQHFAPQLPHPKTLLTGGVRREECAALITHYFRTKRTRKNDADICEQGA